MLQTYSLSRQLLYNPTFMGISSEIFGITPKQSDLPCYGLEKATPPQDEQYQKRGYRSKLSECLSVKGLQDFPSVFSALRVSQKYKMYPLQNPI